MVSDQKKYPSECPRCSAPLTIIKGKTIRCEYCGFHYSIEEEEAIQEERQNGSEYEQVREEQRQEQLHREQELRAAVEAREKQNRKEQQKWNRWLQVLKYYYISLGLLSFLAFLTEGSSLASVWLLLFFLGPIIISARKPDTTYYQPSSRYGKKGKIRTYLRICLISWGIFFVSVIPAAMIRPY